MEYAESELLPTISKRTSFSTDVKQYYQGYVNYNLGLLNLCFSLCKRLRIADLGLMADRLEPLYKFLLKDHYESLDLLFHLAHMDFDGNIPKGIADFPIMYLDKRTNIADAEYLSDEDALSEWSDTFSDAGNKKFATELTSVDLKASAFNNKNHGDVKSECLISDVQNQIEYQMELLRLKRRQERFEHLSGQRSVSPDRILPSVDFSLTNPSSLVPSIMWEFNRRERNPLLAPRKEMFQGEQELVVDSLYTLLLFPPERSQAKLLKHITENNLRSFHQLIKRYASMHQQITER